MSPDARKVQVEIEGRTLTLSNLDKVLYPEAGFTKAQVIDYYHRISPVMLPYIAARPVTITTHTDGKGWLPNTRSQSRSRAFTAPAARTRGRPGMRSRRT